MGVMVTCGQPSGSDTGPVTERASEGRTGPAQVVQPSGSPPATLTEQQQAAREAAMERANPPMPPVPEGVQDPSITPGPLVPTGP